MNTIIIYATKHGAAKSCAEILAKKLTGKVELFNIKEGKVPELEQYDKVILGGSIYAGTMFKEMKDFYTNNLKVLTSKKLGLYICCMNKKEAEKQLNAAYPQELLDAAAAKDSFGGEFKFKEMSFMEKLITKMVSKMLAKEDPTLAIDTKKNLSMISEESINRFAELMN